MANKIKMTYELAMAAGQDAANRQMRKEGRQRWSLKDKDLAAETFHKLYGQYLIGKDEQNVR